MHGEASRTWRISHLILEGDSAIGPNNQSAKGRGYDPAIQRFGKDGLTGNLSWEGNCDSYRLAGVESKAREVHALLYWLENVAVAVIDRSREGTGDYWLGRTVVILRAQAC